MSRGSRRLCFALAAVVAAASLVPVPVRAAVGSGASPAPAVSDPVEAAAEPSAFRAAQPSPREQAEASAHLRGLVIDTKDAGVPGQIVAAYDAETWTVAASAATAANGSFDVVVPPGRYYVGSHDPLNAFDDGYWHFDNAGVFSGSSDRRWATAVAVDTAAVADLTILVGPVFGSPIAGTVRNAQGTPIGGIGITAVFPGTNPAAPFTTVSAADGSFSLPRDEYNYLRLIDPSGTYPAIYWSGAPFAALNFGVARTNTTADVVMPAAAHLSGKLTDEQGNGISGVGVSVFDDYVPSPSPAFASGVTSADGSYSIAVPPSSAASNAYAPGYAVAFVDPSGVYAPGWYSDRDGSHFASDLPSTVVVSAIAGTGIDVTLPRAVRVAGRATDETGSPVAGVIVADSLFARATTAGDGSYSISLAPGVHILTFTDTHNSHLSASLDVNAATDVSDADEVMAHAPVISGMVTSVSGDPIPGALIEVDDRGSGGFSLEPGTVAASDGTFSIHVQPATPPYVASFGLKGTDPSVRHPQGWYDAAGPKIVASGSSDGTAITVASGDVTGIRLVMPDFTAVGGRVTGPDGRGVPGVQVRTGNYLTLTDADGGYGVLAVPGSYDIHVAGTDTLAGGYYSAAGFAYVSSPATSVAVGTSNLTDLDVSLPAKLHVSGTVRGADGETLANESLEISSASSHYTVTTDADGAYSAVVVPDTYRVNVWDRTGRFCSGYWSATGFSYASSGAGTIAISTSDATGVDLTLPYLPRLEGRVEDANGAGIAGVTVRATRATTGGQYEGSTDAAGNFSIPVPHSASYGVQLIDPARDHANGWLGSSGFTRQPLEAATVAVATSDVMLTTLVTPTLFHITGRVRTAAGEPVAGAFVVVGDDTSTTGSDGSYRAAVLPGAYTINFRSTQYANGYYSSGGLVADASDASAITMTNMDLTGYDVVMPALPHLTGVVTSAAGRPMSGVAVGLYVSTWTYSPRVTTTTGADGSYSFTLQPGSYYVYFTGVNGSYAGAYYTPTGASRSRPAESIHVAFADVSGIDAALTTVPDPPAIASVLPGPQKATVTWSAPASDGGSAVTGYTVTATPGNKTCTTSGLSCVVTGLTDGTAYQFRVTAANAIGTGPASPQSDPATPLGTPSAPWIVSVTMGDRSGSISWQGPGLTGGLPLLGYTVTTNPASEGCSAGSTTYTCVVPNLVPGTSYTFSVAGYNSLGLGAAAASASKVAITVPDAPANVSAIQGSAVPTEIRLSWTVPSANWGTIQGYTITANPGNYTWTTPGAAPGFAVDGLPVGATLTWTVAATNQAGTGPAGISSAITVGAPDAPLNAYAHAGDGSAVVSWTAPSGNNAPITNYVVTSSDATHGCTATPSPADNFYCTVDGLTNGVAYRFTIVAINEFGTGLPATTGPVVPVGPPGRPLHVSAVARNASVVVTWSSPTDDGGTPITGFRVSSAAGGVCVWTSGPLACTVGGLTNGLAYTFTVAAENAVGYGPESEWTLPAVPATLPGAPGNVGASPGPGRATVSWSAAAANGSAVTRYTVTSNPESKTCVWTSGPLSCTVGGLTPGRAYTFTVTAANGAGTGPSSRPSAAVTPLGSTATLRLSSRAGGVPGVAQTLTVSAIDAAGNKTPGYRGTIQFTSSDAFAALPSQYTFTAADAGAHVFSVTFNTAGTHSVTAKDTRTPSIAGSQTAISVSYQAATYHPIVPARVLDSRPTAGGVANIGLSGSFGAGVVRTFRISGVVPVGRTSIAVPASATAVTGNLTVVGATASGVVALGPTMAATGATTTMSIAAGDIRANNVTLALGPGGTLAGVYRSVAGASAHLVFDVTGYFTPDGAGARYHTLTPGRILDSRPSSGLVTNIGLSGKFGSGVVRTIKVAGVNALGWNAPLVPANATAVTGNLTVTNATASGYVAVGPTMTSSPKTSTLNTQKGSTRANGVTVQLGSGSVQAVWIGAAGSSADLVFDVTGYFTADGSGLSYHPIDPTRVLNSASNLGVAGPFLTNAPRGVGIGGLGEVPRTAQGISGNLAISSPTSSGYAFAGNVATSSPRSSSVNTTSGLTVANGLDAPLSSSGSLYLVWVGAARSTAQLVLDITGYWG